VSDGPQVIEHHEIANGNLQQRGPNVAPDRSQLVGICNRQVGWWGSVVVGARQDPGFGSNPLTEDFACACEGNQRQAEREIRQGSSCHLLVPIEGGSDSLESTLWIGTGPHRPEQRDGRLRDPAFIKPPGRGKPRSKLRPDAVSRRGSIAAHSYLGLLPRS